MVLDIIKLSSKYAIVRTKSMRCPSAPVGLERIDLSEAIIDAAASAICVLDPVGRIIRWNRAAAALTGLPADRILGNSFEETLLFPADIDKWKLELGRISAVSVPRHLETRWRTHDGSACSVTCSSSVIRDSADEAGYVVCTVIDSLSREFMKDRSEELHVLSSVLHDTISQDLVALSFSIGGLETNIGGFETMANGLRPQTGTASALDLIDRCCRHIRVLGYMLAPPLLCEATLEASIERFTGYVREETGVTFVLDVDPVSDSVSPYAQLLIFTVVQAWTVRGMRSGAGSKVTIRLRNQGARTVLELEMVRPEPADRALLPGGPLDAGWSAIRERARAFGGEFDTAADEPRVFARLSLPVAG
jgi:PAS domain S-box-containing protein